MKRSYLLYGVVAGVLLVVLQAVQYKTMIRDMRLELYAGVIAILFMIIGVVVGLQFVKRKSTNAVDSTKANQLNLSERELEVLHLLADGYSNQEIADKLFVSLNTIKTHISKLYQKLNVSRRTQAVQKARDLAILIPPKG
ncbi:LuxR C-terminal-related transcriptional regulator [Marinoscillum pacificum]|uniref:LuxR C-terminal-related transcriptional regulator n=1 Tax=Marinoscillum pacificum TaxID=392723 RepID=UPI0021585114|nr:LuxR C-terminal-related transcriptional regulator [Marinoscillum pacificum]